MSITSKRTWHDIKIFFSWTDKACYQGWSFYADGCFKTFEVPRPWREARAQCRLFPQGDLASFDSAADQHSVQTLIIRDTSEPYWIGLRGNVWIYFLKSFIFKFWSNNNEWRRLVLKDITFDTLHGWNIHYKTQNNQLNQLRTSNHTFLIAIFHFLPLLLIFSRKWDIDLRIA